MNIYFFFLLLSDIKSIDRLLFGCNKRTCPDKMDDESIFCKEKGKMNFKIFIEWVFPT